LSVPIPPQPDRGVPVGPTIDTDRSGRSQFKGRLYVVYTDFGQGGVPNTDIFVRFSNDMGVTWSDPPTRVNDDGGTNSQFLPWLDVDQETGLVGVVWYDTRNDPNNQLVETFMAVSTNGGVSFQPNIRVSDGQSDQSVNNPNRTTNNYLEYIGVAILDCVAFPVWSDNSLNPADLHFFTDQLRVPCVEADRADLSIIKEDNPDPVEVGGELTYRIRVRNLGPSNATGVILTDTLPANINFVSASSGCSRSGNIVTCNIGNMNHGESAVRLIRVRPTAPGGFSNTATVRANETDPDAANNTVTTVTTVK
jgi:uncharacterized repeat protein (TIGR01451 family)